MLTQKGVPFSWGVSGVTAFQTLKEKMTTGWGDSSRIFLARRLLDEKDYVVEGAMKAPPFFTTKDKILEADKHTRDLDTDFAKITEQIKDISFRLRLSDTWKIHNVFHVNLWKTFGDVPDDGKPGEQPEVEENEEILVPEQWQEVDFPSEWKLDISKTLLNEAQQPMKMSIERLGLTDQYKLLRKSKSRKDLGLLMQRPQYREISESVSSSRPSNSRRQTKKLTLCLHPEIYKDTEGLYRCKLCNKLIASEYLQNGVTVLTKEQVAEKELKYSEPYILPPGNAKLQPMESASNWHTNALKEIAKLQYCIISRIDAIVKAKQSATPSTSPTPCSTASQQLVPLNYNTSASSSILPRMFLTLQSSAMPTDGFHQSESPFIEEDLADAFNPSLRMTYDEQMTDELDFNLANAFPEPDSISESEPEVINEDDEVRRLNTVKMETDDVKVEEPSTSTSTSSTSLKRVSKIGDMTIIDYRWNKP
ncbi:hypothetical protein L7F22_059360 [Adiantum nelumboides]|nr:hypothetical protein [Adiantum nelumboides]